jgi:ribosome assembly protein 1
MMGRELLPVEEVLAGNVFAIGGLHGQVWRTATLCSGGVLERGVVDLEQANEMGALINLGGVSEHVEWRFIQQKVNLNDIRLNQL